MTLAAACYPVAPALFVVAAAAFVLAAPFARGWGARSARSGIAIAAALAAVVLLFPWPLAYAGSHLDAASLGFAFRPDLDLSRRPAVPERPLGRRVDDVGSPGRRRRSAVHRDRRAARRGRTRGWVLAVVGWAIVWVPEQVAPDRSMLAPEAGLTLAAFGLAIALGIGASVLVDGIRTLRFGWRQPAAILGGVALLLPMLGFTADAFDGRWHAPRTGWVDTLAFTDSLVAKGQFRILWLGDPSVLPLDPVVLPDGTGYTLTRNGPGNSAELLRAPEDDADRAAVNRAIELARDGRTNRLGRLLAPTGVRWVALPSTQGPGGGSAPATLPGLAARARRAARPRAAATPVAASRSTRTSRGSPCGPRSPRRRRRGPGRTTRPGPRRTRRRSLRGASRSRPTLRAAPGVVLWGEAYDTAWEATGSGRKERSNRSATSARSDGRTATGSRDRVPVALAFADQWQRWALLGASLLIWLFVVWRWWRTRVRSVRPTSASTRERRADACPS